MTSQGPRLSKLRLNWIAGSLPATLLCGALCSLMLWSPDAIAVANAPIRAKKLPTVPVDGWGAPFIDGPDGVVDGGYFPSNGVSGSWLGFDGGGGPYESVNKSASTKGSKSGDCNSGNLQKRPIAVDSGTKLETYPIFALPGEMGLSLTLYYNSALKVPQTQSNPYWSTNLQYSLIEAQCFINKQTGEPICHSMIYLRPDGSEIVFSGAPQVGPYTENGGGSLATLTYNSTSATYILHDEDGTTKVFDAGGSLKSITDRSGISWTISTSSSSNGTTYTVTQTGGKSYSITYGAAVNGITPMTVTDPAGNLYTIQKNGGNFLSIAYPGTPSTTISFKYSSVFPDYLTEVDYNGVPYDYTSYDTNSNSSYYGWATANYLADNSDSIAISYGQSAAGNLQATLTNALGHRQVQTYDGTNGAGGAYNGQLSEVSNDAVSTCSAVTTRSRSYDANGNLSQTIDANGNVHTYTYAATGQLQTETEAAGTSLARTTDYVWDPNLQLNRLLSVTVEGWSRTDYTYNAQNRLASIKVTNLSSIGGSANQALTTTYGYILYANGMVRTMTVIHPSPNNSDTDTYTYDTQGNLASFADGLGHTTTYSNYNGLGEAGRVVGPNGDTTDYGYDARGRMHTKTTYPNGTAATWTYSYDGFGLLSRVSTPDGQVTTWTRDAEMRVTTITHNDKDGASTETLAYDANGDVVSDKITRGSDVGKATTYLYDALGRIYQVKGSHGQVLTYAYDGNGNTLSVTDALNHKTSYTYDGLGRRAKSIDAANGAILYAYDAGNHLTRVTDPRNLTTTYAYDGLDQLWRQVSPDTGTTSFSYDSYGRRVGTTRADGITLSYGYDAINRPTTVTASGQTQTLSWDTCTNGKGRLCLVTDAHSTVSYTYNAQGQVTGRGFAVDGKSYALGFAYDNYGRLGSVSYPDGNVALYDYANGAIKDVQVRIGSTTVCCAANSVAYRPMDLAMSNWTSNSGLTNTITYDSDLRPTAISVPNVESLAFAYDTADRITTITNSLDSAMTQTFGYDALGRLTGVSSGADNESLSYDPNGNRLSAFVNGVSWTYVPSTTSNRLAYASRPSWAANFQYDANGNLLGTAHQYWTYDVFNRMRTTTPLSDSPVTTYDVNPEGQRLRKYDTSGASTWFAPGTDGTLLAEDLNGTWRDYVWLNGRLVAVMRSGALYAVHTDQTGRPQAITDASRLVQWRARGLAWDRAVTTNTWGDFNLGFPGQYYDSEEGKWYNGHRDYDPVLGFYLESDPLGLAGGINTYAYVLDNPLNGIDPMGLGTFAIGGAASAELTAMVGISLQLSVSWNSNALSDLSQWRIGGILSITPLTEGSTGVGASAGALLTYSPTNNVNTLNGWGVDHGGSGGEGPVLGYDMGNPYDPCNRTHNLFIGAGLKITGAVPGELHTGMNWTAAGSFAL